MPDLGGYTQYLLKITMKFCYHNHLRSNNFYQGLFSTVCIVKRFFALLLFLFLAYKMLHY